VVVVDPWAVFYAGRENDNLDHGLTVVVLHHLGKNETAGRS
jgi:hypothetical protein